MPLNLDQYATSLDVRGLSWPAPPVAEPPRARPHAKPLPEVRAVIWSIYGSLLAIGGGELVLEHPQKFMMDLALDKTLQEFKMWTSMSRKPGQPAEYLGQLYAKALANLRMLPSPGEKYPEIPAERIWEDIIKKLLQKDYRFDVGFYGSLNEFSRKVAYFFHASLQGTQGYPGAAAALRHIAAAGVAQGWLANGQCFTPLQLQRALAQQDSKLRLDDVFETDLRILSCEHRARKPSEQLFGQLLQRLEARGLQPRQVLYVGSSIPRDLIPARRVGMRTALFAGDRGSVQATAEELKERLSRPDVLLTELAQMVAVIPLP